MAEYLSLAGGLEMRWLNLDSKLIDGLVNRLGLGFDSPLEPVQQLLLELVRKRAADHHSEVLPGCGPELVRVYRIRNQNHLEKWKSEE